jgi:hypothetical protein
MVRLAAVLVASTALVACASRSTSVANPSPAQEPQFASNDARIVACLELRDHIVDLYALEYFEEHNESALTPEERVAFRDGWAEELAKRGTFARFESSCYYGLTPRRYACGMASTSPGRLVQCMKLSSAEHVTNTH